MLENVRDWFVFLIAFYRIVDVMLLKKSINVSKEAKQIIERGNIYDRNGILLSSTIDSYSLSVNPNRLKNKKLTTLNIGISITIDQARNPKKLGILIL